MTTSTLSRDAIRYRPATAEDVPFLRYLYGTTREVEMRMLPWSEAQKVEFLDQQFHAQKSHYEDFYPEAEFLVMETNEGKPVGRLYIDRRPEEIEVIDIALLPELRGHGLGRILLEEVLAEGRETNRRVLIYVENFNPARHLYDRLGFRHIDTNGVYHVLEWSA
jgi:ribosomal protein S18 acetylase RimI-like enzyme